MALQSDIAAVGPALELSLDYVQASLRCVGTLDTLTRRHLFEAVDELLMDVPARITIDVTDLQVADVDGANALANVQRMVRDAGSRLRWMGLDSDHLRGVLPLRYRARRPLRVPASAGLTCGRPAHPSAMPPSA